MAHPHGAPLPPLAPPAPVYDPNHRPSRREIRGANLEAANIGAEFNGLVSQLDQLGLDSDETRDLINDQERISGITDATDRANAQRTVDRRILAQKERKFSDEHGGRALTPDEEKTIKVQYDIWGRRYDQKVADLKAKGTAIDADALVQKTEALRTATKHSEKLQEQRGGMFGRSRALLLPGQYIAAAVGGHRAQRNWNRENRRQNYANMSRRERAAYGVIDAGWLGVAAVAGLLVAKNAGHSIDLADNMDFLPGVGGGTSGDTSGGQAAAAATPTVEATPTPGETAASPTPGSTPSAEATPSPDGTPGNEPNPDQTKPDNALSPSTWGEDKPGQEPKPDTSGGPREDAEGDPRPAPSEDNDTPSGGEDTEDQEGGTEGKEPPAGGEDGAGTEGEKPEGGDDGETPTPEKNVHEYKIGELGKYDSDTGEGTVWHKVMEAAEKNDIEFKSEKEKHDAVGRALKELGVGGKDATMAERWEAAKSLDDSFGKKGEHFNLETVFGDKYTEKVITKAPIEAVAELAPADSPSPQVVEIYTTDDPIEITDKQVGGTLAHDMIEQHPMYDDFVLDAKEAGMKPEEATNRLFAELGLADLYEGAGAKLNKEGELEIPSTQVNGQPVVDPKFVARFNENLMHEMAQQFIKDQEESQANNS